MISASHVGDIARVAFVLNGIWKRPSLSKRHWPPGGLTYSSAVNADDVRPLHALAGRRSHAGPF